MQREIANYKLQKERIEVGDEEGRVREGGRGRREGDVGDDEGREERGKKEGGRRG